MPVFPGRRVAHLDGDFVVLLIGMRINRPWMPHKWLPVLRAMGPMIRELEADPASGFLGATQGLMAGGPALVQYWRSFEHLERYARDRDARHLPAWRAFNRRVRDSGDVGIWHETYRVRAGEYEAIYGNMPRVGLAAVGEHRPIGSTSATAARRIGVRPGDAPPVESY
jgi:fumigallin biosynthesis monooxygenase-like protein